MNVSQSESMPTESGSIAGTAPSKAVASTAVDPVTAGKRALVEWAEVERHLSRQTLGSLDVGFDTVFFPDVKAKLPAIVFKYREGWKARSFPEKHFVAGKGFKLAFWNLERVLEAVLAGKAERVFITEGELDALALVEAGIPRTEIISVPNGAKLPNPKDAESEEKLTETKGFAYVEDALQAGLNRVGKFIWCGDKDGPGLHLRDNMVRIFGAARFCYVEWPEGTKDANDFLKSDGGEALRDLVANGHLPWPVMGLFRLSEMPEPPAIQPWDVGFEAWHGKLQIASRMISVVTGNPNHGKTALWNQIWFQIVKKYDLVMCVASFETRPKPHMRRQLRSLHAGKAERNMTTQEIARADKWIDDHYLFLVHPEQRPTIEWFLDMAEVAVIRHGASINLADPFNRFEGSRSNSETETEYVGRVLRTLAVFSNDFNCHSQIVAHPAKMNDARRGTPPELADISGSKHWDNMPDQGFVVHRRQLFDGVNQVTKGALFYRKSRFNDELGFPCVLDYDFDKNRGCFVGLGPDGSSVDPEGECPF